MISTDVFINDVTTSSRDTIFLSLFSHVSIDLNFGIVNSEVEVKEKKQQF